MALYRSYSRVSIPRSASISSITIGPNPVVGERIKPRHSSFASHSRAVQIFPLGRSASTVFSTAKSKAPPPHEHKTPYSLTPYYGESYPHVRHAHGYASDSSAVKLISSLPAYSRQHYSSNRGESYLSDRYHSRPSLYSPRQSYTIHSAPYTRIGYERPRTTYRVDYGIGVDHAVGMYSKSYMTLGTLSKYFLSGSKTSVPIMPTWRSRYSSQETHTPRTYGSRYTSGYGSSRGYGGYRSSYGRYGRY